MALIAAEHDDVAGLRVIRGPTAVASGAIMFSKLGPAEQLVLVNGTPVVVAIRDCQIFSVPAFTRVNDRIPQIVILRHASRLPAVARPAGVRSAL